MYNLQKTNRKINKFLIHCTDTKENMHITVKNIDSWHKQKGWAGIGYHYVVYLDGSVHIGRDINKIGAHCKGYNTGSIGVVYCGGRDINGNLKDTRNNKQKQALLQLLRELKELYPDAKIYGHNDFDKGRACPCFDAKEEYKDI